MTTARHPAVKSLTPTFWIIASVAMLLALIAAFRGLWPPDDARLHGDDPTVIHGP